jgi:hypothetical protein
MSEEEKAKQRIAKIAKSQELLATAVNNLDRLFYEALLTNVDKIAEDALELERIFKQFNSSQHSKVIKQFAGGVLEVGALNADYFKDIAANLDSKDYTAIKKDAQSTLLKRFGLNADGSIVPGMYLDSFINDKSIARAVREQAYKWQSGGMGLDEFKRNLKLTVLGQPGSNGIYSKYYNTYAYDTYQQADAQIQKHYADKLGLKAFLYLGGKMTTSRAFCVERDGKVFTDTEIADWITITFTGKPKTGYNAFTDRGGYNCRHHLNAITNAMAVSRRTDLEIDEAGNLVKKGTAKKAETLPAAKEAKAKEATATEAAAITDSNFKPAKDIKAAVDFAIDNKIAKVYDIGDATVKELNIVNEAAAYVYSKYNLKPLDQLTIARNLGNSNGKHISFPSGARQIKMNGDYLERDFDYSDHLTYKTRNVERLEKWKAHKEKTPLLFKGSHKNAKANRAALKDIEKAAKFERWSLSHQYGQGSTMVHELGHKLQDEIFGLHFEPLSKAAGKNARDLKTRWNRLFFESEANGDIYKISNYATTNEAELFAEVFTMYRYEPDKIPESIKKLLEEILDYARK